MRILGLVATIGCLMALCFWAFYHMVRVRPNVSRPEQVDIRGGFAKLAVRLRAHVEALAGTIGPRNVLHPDNLEATRLYIKDVWNKEGYQVREDTFQVDGIVCSNLSVEVGSSGSSNRIIIVGAHYDTIAYSPGANDNGSGVACLLELSRRCKDMHPGAAVRFVAFVNEEPPFFKTDKMGSLVYAEKCRRNNENIDAMICLETIGYYREEKGTQKYPFPFSVFYPDRGDFLAVVGNLRSRELVRSFSKFFMSHSRVPLECVATFGFFTGIDWSDHWSFWEMGYPAIMLTDTALFRYPYYHTVEDTPDKIDFHVLAEIAHGVGEAIVRMAQTDDVEGWSGD